MSKTVIYPQNHENSDYDLLLKAKTVTYAYKLHNRDLTRAEIFLSENVLEIVIEGEKQIYINNSQVKVDAGNAVFLKKGAYIVSENSDENTGKYISLNFYFGTAFISNFVEQNYINYDIKLISEVNPEKFFQFNSTPQLIKSIDLLLEYFVNKFHTTPCQMRLKLEEIILNLVESDRKKQFVSFLNHLQKTERLDLPFFMEKIYKEKLSLEKIAQFSGRSLSIFKKEFKSIFNTSPIEWIYERRLNDAYVLLKESNQNVDEIAFQCGFENTSHFIKRFKNKFGITPKKLQISSTNF